MWFTLSQILAVKFTFTILFSPLTPFQFVFICRMDQITFLLVDLFDRTFIGRTF
jgi:hypothetical protein